jgi:tRNA A37 threonylcarbamoyladenosine modification protein TsaB
MYSFLLTLTKTDARLELRKGESVVAHKEWQESRDMGQQLFGAIQALLGENGLGPIDVDTFELQTEVSDNFTSVKIAETVAKVYTWGVSVQAKTTKKS